MDARYAVNGGGNRKSRCQNGTRLLIIGMDLKRELINIASQKFCVAQIFLLLKISQNLQNHMESHNRP